MKLYFDTNIIIDILKHREPFFESSNKIFMLTAEEKIEGIVGTSSITDIYYLIRKQYADTKTAVKFIFDLLEIIKPVNTLVDDVFSAAELGFSDFEDAVIAAIAQREKADYIITRNIKDYSKSPVPAITPDEFLAL
ncbi:MAG: PIN domain-containing protein [Treponema sp.]|nr:PIN domain-containing protein [Treponema sp.]